MLQLILGRSGSGKTEYVFSQIKKLVESGEQNILLITPEQYSFVSERRLLKDLGESRVNSVENGSFSRLSNEIARRYGAPSLPVLTKGAKAVVFKKACESVKDDLQLFGKNTDNVAFINSAVDIYDEMKSCRVEADDIMKAADNTEKETLKQKLHDISLIMSAYDSSISGRFLDGACELTRLYEKLKDLDYFTGRTVFIDGFNGFVAQEYKIIEVILSQAKNVYVTFCTDSAVNNDKYNLFSYVNNNINYIKEAAENAGVSAVDYKYLKDNHRFNNAELKSVEQNVFANIKNSSDVEPENIELYCAKTVTDECDRVSDRISKLLRSGVRASDIAVICRDLDKYQKELQFSFSKYNIPYFNDERQSISSQPLIMFVNFMMRCAIYSFSSNDIFSMLKTGLTALDNKEVDALENYAFIWNIGGSKWKKEFVNSPKGFTEELSENDKKQLLSLNKGREYVVDKLQDFVSSCKKKSSAEICKAIYFTLVDFSVDEKLRQLAKSLNQNGKSVLAFEQGRVWDLLMDILDKLATITGDEPVSVKEFYRMFNLMIMNEDLGSVPSGLDNVQIGSADRIRCNNPYAVFVVGANEGEFPKSVASSGLLSENDRSILIENKFKLYSYGETLNAQEKYFAYMALSAPIDRLYVSYIGASSAGAESIIVTELKNIFENIKTQSRNFDVSLSDIETDANAFEIMASNYENNTELTAALKEYFNDKPEFESRLGAVKRLSSNDEIKITNPDLATRLFKKDMYLSVSKIEDYYKCAFRYFCKFGLNARPRIKAEMNPMQTGTVIHYVLESFLKEHPKDEFVNLDDMQITSYVKKYLKYYLENKMGDYSELSVGFKYKFMRLSKLISCVVFRLRDEFSNSDFVPRAFELSIGNGENGESVKSQILHLPDGGTIQIRGSIDRVDTYTENGIQYVRVVDYKSGVKKFRLFDIMHGLNLQMFVYLFNLCKSDSELAGKEAGVLYLHSSRDIYDVSRSSNVDKTIERKDDDTYKMIGVVLEDTDGVEICNHMEHGVKGKYIDVTYRQMLDEKCKVIAADEMAMISQKTDSLITQMGVNLHNGKIMQKPFYSMHHKDTCDFCDYSDVCANKKEILIEEVKEPKRDWVVLDELRKEYGEEDA